MGSLLRWLVGLAGLAGLVRLLRGRHPSAPESVALEPPEDDPAAGLRRELAAKLAEGRRAESAAAGSGQLEEATTVPPADAGPQPTMPAAPESVAAAAASLEAPETGEDPVSMDDRRARIRARAQEAIDAMKAGEA